MAEAPFVDRVDDAILCASFRLARTRKQTLRGSIEDFRATCVETIPLDPDEIWRLRTDRCSMLLAREDSELRHLATRAMERER